jgi:hypothetical protein
MDLTHCERKGCTNTRQRSAIDRRGWVYITGSHTLESRDFCSWECVILEALEYIEQPESKPWYARALAAVGTLLNRDSGGLGEV